MTRECPSCGLEVAGGRESCPTCWATLVDDADAVVTCPQCGRACPTRMHTCPGCLALLRPDPGAVEDVLVDAIGRNRRLPRPPGRPPFETGPGCTVLRLAARGGLVVCGENGFVEAGIEGPGIAARPPLTCTTGGVVLFRLRPYGAADASLVATGDDGAALGTYLRSGSVLSQALEVRDEASAPVARFEPAPAGVGFQLVRTGGGVIATGDQRDVEIDEWIDDEWRLQPTTTDLPLRPLAFVALVVAAKVLFGRAEPVPAPKERRPDDREIATILGIDGAAGGFWDLLG